MARCPECGSSRIEQYRSPYGPMWCLDCGFRVEDKTAIPNPFMEEVDGEADGEDSEPPGSPLGLHCTNGQELSGKQGGTYPPEETEGGGGSGTSERMGGVGTLRESQAAMAAQNGGAAGGRGAARRLRWILPIVAGLVLLGLAWFSFTADAEITALRNVVYYKVVQGLGGPRLRSEEPAGLLSGRIQDEGGAPVAGAVVLVASPLGEVYTAESDLAGRYRIDGVPPGRYVPVAGKRGYEDALEQVCGAGLCFKDVVRVRSDQEVGGIDFALAPAVPPEIALDDSLVVSPTVEVEVGAPFPSKSLRTHFSFERAGLRINDCWLYEPLAGEGPLPTMLLVLPGPVIGWEIIPVPFAAEGFSVLACYPLRGIEIDEDAGDLLTALAYVRRGRVPSRADPERLALVGASFTSLHTWRLLQLTELFDVTLVLGGMADGFAFRHGVETGAAQARPPFDQVLMALGFPNTSPELYFRYSVLYHMEGLPPACLLHGVDDELSPFSQSVGLAEAMERQGLAYEFYAYEGLKHYFSTRADDLTTQQMFQDSLDCLHRWLESD
jgi:hypothetical protein